MNIYTVCISIEYLDATPLELERDFAAYTAEEAERLARTDVESKLLEMSAMYPDTEFRYTIDSIDLTGQGVLVKHVDETLN